MSSFISDQEDKNVAAKEVVSNDGDGSTGSCVDGAAVATAACTTVDGEKLKPIEDSPKDEKDDSTHSEAASRSRYIILLIKL